ncbi:MAG: HNH endonuclease [Bacilli bacterium]|nr:HNH endonuclease [Bacilli bacterium]MBO7527325.1 HNH endonuclease [Clostridia bacterium]
MNKEIWKDIKDYEGLYQVSNFGRVKSLEKKVWNRYEFIVRKERILKTKNNSKEYCIVKLYKDNKHYNKKIHRLVAEAFIPNPNDLPQINHIDGNKNNNNANNLEWCTNKENQIHAWNNNLQKKKYSKDHPLSKKVYQYDKNMNLIKIWYSVSEAEKVLHLKNVSTVCYNKRKTAGGFIWRYEND